MITDIDDPGKSSESARDRSSRDPEATSKAASSPVAAEASPSENIVTGGAETSVPAVPAPEAPDPPVEPTKPCIQCAQPIPQAAKKCRQCSSFQNWRRHLTLGNNSLTVALAGLTVLGILGPFVMSFWGYVQTEVTGRELSSLSVTTGERFQRVVLLHNPNRKVAFVLRAKVRILDQDLEPLQDARGNPLWLAQMTQDPEFPQLPAGKQVIRKFHFSKQARNLPTDQDLVAAELVITVVNGRGEIQEIALPQVHLNRFRKSASPSTSAGDAATPDIPDP